MSYDSKGTLNKVILIGRLGQDPELKYTPSNTPICTLSLATNTSRKDQSGNVTDQTEWHRIIVWRKLAEIISKYAKKGSRVYVEGRLTTRSWDDKDGNKRYSTEVVASSIILLDNTNNSGGSQQNNSIPDSGDGPDDDLPF